jgi:hypothetical protein
MNKPSLEKFRKLKEILATEKGALSLFAITKRREGVGK